MIFPLKKLEEERIIGMCVLFPCIHFIVGLERISIKTNVSTIYRIICTCIKRDTPKGRIRQKAQPRNAGALSQLVTFDN